MVEVAVWGVLVVMTRWRDNPFGSPAGVSLYDPFRVEGIYGMSVSVGGASLAHGYYLSAFQAGDRVIGVAIDRLESQSHRQKTPGINPALLFD